MLTKLVARVLKKVAAVSQMQIITPAENRALDMKVATKSAHHQDIAKYTGQSIDYTGAPKLTFKYQNSISRRSSESRIWSGI